ncbi:MAG: hypothetical protein K1X83_00480 [Oligoflexia bacterium]|nr:hypothetical protein [Oligoflexia bacterium]
MENTEGCCGTAGQPCGFKCPLTGFQFCFNKAFVVAALILVVWNNLFAWYWHGVLLSPFYQATAALWRAPAEMKTAALNGGIALFSIMAAYIFVKGYEGRGWREGLRFGIIMTLMFFGMGLVTYATQPIPFDIILRWSLGDLISYSIGGILLTFILPKLKAC